MRTHKTVLVIDDETHVRRIVELKLSHGGYDVLSATNGLDGLDLVVAKRPDAVISDIMMPGLDGRSLCEKTNDLKADRPFLTVIMTGRIETDEQDWLSRMRDTVFMEKPFSPSRLMACLDRYFGIER